MRRLVVPFTLRLDRLHLTLQAAFDWTDSHLFEFTAGDGHWGLPDLYDDFGPQPIDARKARLCDIVRDTGAKLILILRDADDARLPAAARAALLEMAEQIEMLNARVEKLDTKIVAAVKADEIARRLTSIPGVGPIIAATVRATIQDPAVLKTGRDLAAWIGITPRANSSGGKERLGRISKQGNKQLRTLLIVGATSILKQARRGVKLSSWIISLMARRPYKVAAVALANKIARTIWAILVKGGIYQSPAAMARA